MNVTGKVYLGDGVYAAVADYDLQTVILTTENGVATTNTIVLEPEVLAKLMAYCGKEPMQ